MRCPKRGSFAFAARFEELPEQSAVDHRYCWAATEGSFDVSDLLPHTDKHIPTMCKKVTEILGSVSESALGGADSDVPG